METVLNNARLVLGKEVVCGSLAMEDGLIAGIGEPSMMPQAIDCNGDYIVPGLIDIHTDNIEVHLFPRSGVVWPTTLHAILMHDHQMAASGITTVLDALSLGDYDEQGKRAETFTRILEALDFAAENGLLRSEHYLHFRCELSDQRFAEIVDPLRNHGRLKLLGVMDHTPGQGSGAIFRYFARRGGREKILCGPTRPLTII